MGLLDLSGSGGHFATAVPIAEDRRSGDPHVALHLCPGRLPRILSAQLDLSPHDRELLFQLDCLDSWVRSPAHPLNHNTILLFLFLFCSPVLTCNFLFTLFFFLLFFPLFSPFPLCFYLFFSLFCLPFLSLFCMNVQFSANGLVCGLLLLLHSEQMVRQEVCAALLDPPPPQLPTRTHE